MCEGRSDRAHVYRVSLSFLALPVSLTAVSRSTAIGFFNLQQDAEVQYLDTLHPVLDMCSLAGDRLLISVDASRSKSGNANQNEESCQVLEAVDGKVKMPLLIFIIC